MGQVGSLPDGSELKEPEEKVAPTKDPSSAAESTHTLRRDCTCTTRSCGGEPAGSSTSHSAMYLRLSAMQSAVARGGGAVRGRAAVRQYSSRPR